MTHWTMVGRRDGQGCEIRLNDGRRVSVDQFLEELDHAVTLAVAMPDATTTADRDGLGLAETTFRKGQAPAHPPGFRPIGGGRG